MSLIYKGQTIANVGGTGGGGGVPKGTIVIWSGAATEIPTGWAICDGQNGTPDLRDRFVLGAGTNHSVGETGGAEGVKMTDAMLRYHSHELYMYDNNVGSSDGWIIDSSSAAKPYGTHGTTAPTGKFGNSQEPIPTMPPYYALCYIMKIAEDCGGASSGGSSEEIYSTEETRIGTWIDGKPLYRMYLEGTLPTDNQVHFIIEYPEECDVKMYQNYFERSDGFSTGTFCSPNANYNSQSWIDKNQHQLGVQIGYSYSPIVGGKKCWLIIEYTKTTDEATS